MADRKNIANKIADHKNVLLERWTALPAFHRSFAESMVAGAFVFVLLGTWLQVRQDNTAQILQPLVPFKTAVLELPEVEQALEHGTPDVKLSEQADIKSLPPAPIEGLSEDNGGKFLPVIRLADDVTPFQAYKKSFTPAAGVPTVSVVVLYYGMSDATSQAMLKDLPENITLGLTPYAADPVKWAASARTFGREFWLSLPMQTKDFGISDSGPLSILKNVQEQENVNRLLSVLSVAPGYTGVITQKNHDFNGGENILVPLMKQIFGRGLGLVESNPDITPIGLKSSTENEAPLIQNNIWLDADLQPGAIQGALKTIEQKARRDGHVVVFTHPYPAVLKALGAWTKDFDKMGLQLAPLSAQADKN